MIIVTSGRGFYDIDAYAGCIAYAELLKKQGYPAKAVATAPLNESITQSIRNLDFDVTTLYRGEPDDSYVLVDISEAQYFERFVTDGKVAAIIDHHPGFEEYWQDRLGPNAMIEPVGAACTLVYECWQRAGMLDTLPESMAKALTAGILDNTLNFGADVTTERDVDAYEDMIKRFAFPSDWPAVYFGECQESIEKNVVTAISNDTKTIHFAQYPEGVVVGQLAVWDTKKLLNDHRDDFVRTLSAKSDKWCMNLINISEKKSYFLCDNPEIAAWFSGLLGLQFVDGLAAADRSWLRKEIIRKSIQA